MIYWAGTSYAACTLRIGIEANRQCQVNLKVEDDKQKDTVFTDRMRIYNAGEKNPLFVQMPVTGKGVLITVYEEGTRPDSEPVNFRITGIRKLPIARQMDIVDLWNPRVRNFIPFAQRFAYNAGVLPTYSNRYYISDKGNFRIKYVEKIILDNGQESVTPARIGIFDKVIEVSKKFMKPLTVSGREDILYHEFSHLNLNNDMKNESEADINGLIIGLGLGNPVIEAKQTYLLMFSDAEGNIANENRERYEKVAEFIDGFEALSVKYL